MMLRSPWPRLFLFCAIAWLAAPIVIGEDAAQQPTKGDDTSPAPADEQVLQDLQRIRERLGGSVLRGTALDAPELDTQFDAGIKKLLGLSGTDPEVDQQPARVLAKAVLTIRQQCARMDRIANEIESERMYQRADELRRSANELRSVARQLDTQPTHPTPTLQPEQPAKPTISPSSSSSAP